MKKLFTLLMLFVAIVTGARATDYHYVDLSTDNLDLTSNFRSAALSQDGTSRVIDGTTFKKTRKFGSTVGSIGNPNDIGTKFIVYEVKSTVTNLDIYVYNKNSADKTLYVAEIEEGASEATTTGLTATKNTGTKLSYAVKSSKNCTLYFFVNSTDVLIGDIVAKETGDPLPTGGEAGFSMSFNQGRSAIKSGTATTIENMEFHLNSNYSALSSTVAPIKNKGTNYVKFTTTAPTKVTVSVSGSSTYYISSTINASESPAPTAYTATAEDVELGVGTWYIVPNGANVNITGLSFAGSKTVANQVYAGVKVGGTTVVEGFDFTKVGNTITMADAYETAAAPTDIKLINLITYTDESQEAKDVDITFGSTPSEGYFTGSTFIGETQFTVMVPETESYTVSYNAGAYGSGSIASGKKYKNVDFTLSSETFTREGFVQSGWALTDGGEKAYDLGGTYSENAAIELFPAWTEANTYFAAFSVAEGTPAGWTFSIPDPDTWADNNARVAFVKDFDDNSVKAPKTNNLGDSYVAFAKSTSAYAIYDLGSSVTVFGIKAQLYGGSSDPFNIKIDYLGADATTVKKSYNVSLNAGNWKLNTITKSDVINDVRYIKIYGGTKWVVMSGFSVTSTADAVSTGANITTNAGKWASFTPTYNAIVPAGTEAYIITGIGAGAILEGSTVSVMEAGKGYFIKGEASNEYTATYTTEAADATDGNMLVGCAKDAALAVNSGATPYQYFLGTDQDTQKAGLFYVGATAITIPAGKCYLLSNSNTPMSLSLPFEGDPTAIINVNANDNADTVAPIKVIKDGQLYIGNYNVAGQLVK